MRNHHKAEYIIFHINTKNLTGNVIFDEIYEQKFTLIIWFLRFSWNHVFLHAHFKGLAKVETA